MTQYALPNANGALFGNWVEINGDGDGDHFDELDEGFGAGRGTGSGPDDVNTAWKTSVEDGSRLHTGLEVATDPTVHTDHKYKSRSMKNQANGRQLDIQLEVLQSSGVIAEYTWANVDGGVWTTREDTLTEGEAATITDYTNLEMATRVYEQGGGAARIGWESAHEFECPDAGGGPGYCQLQYTSEPPTPNAWNQLKRDVGSGDYKKLLFEGE